MAYTKGDQRINRGGRPKGSKDKKWARIQTFWDILMSEWDDLKPAQRAYYAFEGFKLHFDRAMAHLPADQDESLENALAAHKTLNEMVANARNGSSRNEARMDDRGSETSIPSSSVQA